MPWVVLGAISARVLAMSAEARHVITASDFDVYIARSEKARARRADRAPPMLGRTRAGQCRWCHHDILFPDDHKRAGEVNTRRGWHPECVGFYQIAANLHDAARRVLERRDRGVCLLCRQVCGPRFLGWRRWPEQLNFDYFDRPRRVSIARDRGLAPRYTPVDARWTSGWHVDHVVPLWSVRDATLAQRGCFWSVVNLQTLCETCHKAKSRREAAALAAWRVEQGAMAV